MDPIDKRLQDLEMTVAHLQRMYEQLNEVVTQQALDADAAQRRITRLESIVRDLKEKQVEGQAIDPLDEKPPHY